MPKLDHIQLSYNPDDLSQVDEINEDLMSDYEASVENQFGDVTIDFRREFGLHQSKINAFDKLGNVIDDDDVYNEINEKIKEAFNDF